MAQPSLDNRLNAAPRPWIRNSQTPPKSELRYSKPSSGNSQTLPKSELRYRKNSLVCSSLTPPPQARQRGRRIHVYLLHDMNFVRYCIMVPSSSLKVWFVEGSFLGETFTCGDRQLVSCVIFQSSLAEA